MEEKLGQSTAVLFKYEKLTTRPWCETTTGRHFSLISCWSGI